MDEEKHLCTGNPDQLWVYDNPGYNGQNIHVVMSEAEILATMFDYWSKKMKEIGKSDEVSEVNCVDDWIVVHWAYKEK